MLVWELVKILTVIKINVVNKFFFFYKYIMVRYHGRARQLVNLNRKQAGQKMAGTLSRTGALISSWRIHQTRVNGNVAVGCVDANGAPNGLRRTFDKKLCIFCVNNTNSAGRPMYLLKARAPASRQCAGGVNRHFPLGCR